MAQGPARPAVALTLAVLVGLAGLRIGGAPLSYLIVNAAALALALAFAFALRRIPSRTLIRASLVACPVLALAALLIGPEVDGVHRWLPLGPLRLHAAMLAGPVFVAALQLEDSPLATAASVALAAVIAFQPDFATALALTCAAALLLAARVSRGRIIALVAALASLGTTVMVGDQLQPVPFVEGVLQALFSQNSLLGALAVAALIAAILLPALNPASRMQGGLALSGWFAGLTIASLVGNYPTPLIGYGAAPIIGYGLALALLGRTPRPAAYH